MGATHWAHPILSCLRCTAYLVVADEAYGRTIPFAYLERVRDEFQEKWAHQARTALAQSLDSSFGYVCRRGSSTAQCLAGQCHTRSLVTLAVRPDDCKAPYGRLC